jgi:hypothetical protein
MMAKIVGTSGNDDLHGVNGQPNLIYGDTDGTADPTTQLGNDIITGGANSPDNTIYGDADALMGHGTTGGNDTVIGGANSTNTLVGDSNSNDGAPQGGNDTLIGGTNSANTLIGDIVNAGAGALGGDDTLIGGTGGTNNLIGDFASAGGSADGGNDRLVSAANTTDIMWGDFQTVEHPQTGMNTGGADTFVFGPKNGNDFIIDFQKGVDMIELDSSPTHVPVHAAAHIPAGAGNFPQTFADLNIQIVDANGDGIADASVIQFDAHNSVQVNGFDGSDAAHTLEASDFLFA